MAIWWMLLGCLLIAIACIVAGLPIWFATVLVVGICCIAHAVEQ